MSHIVDPKSPCYRSLKQLRPQSLRVSNRNSLVYGTKLWFLDPPGREIVAHEPMLDAWQLITKPNFGLHDGMVPSIYTSYIYIHTIFIYACTYTYICIHVFIHMHTYIPGFFMKNLPKPGLGLLDEIGLSYLAAELGLPGRVSEPPKYPTWGEQGICMFERLSRLEARFLRSRFVLHVLYIYICIYIYMCICTYSCIYIHVILHIYIYVYIHIYIYRIYSCTYLDIHACIYEGVKQLMLVVDASGSRKASAASPPGSSWAHAHCNGLNTCGPIFLI